MLIGDGGYILFVYFDGECFIVHIVYWGKGA